MKDHLRWEDHATPYVQREGPSFPGLMPWPIVALGVPSRPIERPGLEVPAHRLIVALGRVPAALSALAAFLGRARADGTRLQSSDSR
jgi:hypothetical protein